MGCDQYHVIQPLSWSSDQPLAEMYKDVYLKFPDDRPEDEPIGCLCTFPFNHKNDPELVPVLELALLGAAVVLAHQGLIKGQEDETHLIPFTIPEWILEGIKRKLKEE